MFVLLANPMRDRCEVVRPVARASTREALIAFIARERVEHYVDEFPGGHGNELERSYAFHKVFRKGGPLEWFNMPDINDPGVIVGVPSRQQVMENAGLHWDETMRSIPSVD